ncbi:ribonuclease YeeF family protein [Metabacillus fastidiosus]|uniref:ribonuclease YeeF family protein n=1 Tax=Metabacillus fastidiosus TaxID=1458 RepID=UPI003D2CD6EF
MLDAHALHTGIDEILNKLNVQESQIEEIGSAVSRIISLEDSFKGDGGQAIRSFYEDCHKSFLLFYEQAINEYKMMLNNVKSSLQEFEPAQNGLIRQSFLEDELDSGLSKTRDTTIELTNETNSTISSVRDIIVLPVLNDDQFLQHVDEAKKEKNETVENLNKFDYENKAALTPVHQNIQMMNNYIKEIQSMFASGNLSIDSYESNRAYTFPEMQKEDINDPDPYTSFCMDDRVRMNDVEAADISGQGIEWNPTPTFGINFDQWREQPINAVANLGITASAAYDASKGVNLARKGFGYTKTTRITAQGKERVVVKLNNPQLGGFNKKTYSGTNVTNYPKLNTLVDPMARVKDSLKWGSNKIGYVGVGVTVAGDIIHGVQNNQSKSEIAGNVVGDVAVAGASIAASAAVGAKVGAMAGAFGGPVGVAVGAVAGAAAGIVVTTVLSDFKFMDIDNDGKSDSIGDAVKKGTKGLIDKVGSWFK